MTILLAAFKAFEKQSRSLKNNWTVQLLGNGEIRLYLSRLVIV